MKAGEEGEAPVFRKFGMWLGSPTSSWSGRGGTYHGQTRSVIGTVQCGTAVPDVELVPRKANVKALLL